MDEYHDVIEQLKKQNPQALVVFGSYVWGTPHEDSDLDVLMIKKTDKSRLDRMREAHRNIKSTLPLDIIVLTPQEAKELPKKYSFYKQVIEEGKVIYGKL